MTVWPLPRVTFQELSAISEKRPAALLTTNGLWSDLSGLLSLPVVIQAQPERNNHELFDYLADNLPSQVQVIYALGDDVPVQAGKVIAARNHKPLVVVPSALTSDMMFTPHVTVWDSDGETSYPVHLETGPAAEIIIDWDLILAAPDHLRGAGIVDVLSIITGLLDWRYAAQKSKNPPEQRFAPWAASVAAGLASQALKSASAIGQGNPEALHILLDLMMLITQLSNQLGHTRAQEGSEHYLARILAGRIDPAPAFSEIAGPCLLFVSALHGQDPASLRDAMQGAGVRLDQLRPADVHLTLDGLPALLEQYEFPFSILNDLDPASELIAQALDAAGLALAPGTWQPPQDTQPVLPVQEEAQPQSADETPDASAPVDPASGVVR